MLVLSRKNNQSVVIGCTNGSDNFVRVTVLGIDRDQVRLGFEAQKEVSVHREEVWKRIVAERFLEDFAPPHAGLDRWADDGGPESEES